MRTQPQDIIARLEADNSRLAKEAILKEAHEEGLPEFFEGLTMALDPLVTFGVKQVPERSDVLSGQGLEWPVFKELCRKLQDRSLTGHAARDAIILCKDTDATMTPIDLQMDWIVSKKKYDFIGKRSLYRSDTIREDRKQLVGLLTENPDEVLEEGAQIVADLNKSPIEMLGHVTSSYYSPNLKKSIALGVVRGGKNMMGQKLIIPMENKKINVTVADPVFLDKENKRLNA